MNSTWNECGVAIGSVTQAMNAQKVLAAAALPTQIVKYGGEKSGTKGCVYGLSFYCAQQSNVKSILSSAGIRVREWHTGN